MKWTEVTVTTESEAVEAVSSILMGHGASGVAIEDALDVVHYENSQFGEIVNPEEIDHIKEGALVWAYFPETIFLPEILPTIRHQVSELATFGLNIGAGTVEQADVVESDWATAWKQYYHPVAISRYLTIVPQWEQYEAQHADEKCIILDPGMAFGTGTHPTTRLSLQALEMTLRGGETVIDVGTGSGVLSIASKHLGAEKVYAYDLDEVAVRAAQENMNLNPVAHDVTVAANDLLTGITFEADVVVANILAEIIIRMADDAFRVVKNHGKLIVSGIIADKEAEVRAVLLAAGFTLEESLQQGDWFGLIFAKEVEA